MSLIDQREAIINAAKDNLGALSGNCQSFGGRFAAAEIKRYALQSPAILVACLGIPEIRDDEHGAIDLITQWGTFVICTDKPQLPRDAGALAIVTALLPIFRGRTIAADENVGYPEKVRGENLFSGAIEGQGIALWAITWQQKITITDFDPSGLDDFLLFHADYDLAPPDGAIDAADNINLLQT